MRFTKIIRNWLLFAVSAAALQSCDAVTDDPGPCRGDDTITLSFKMLTSDPLQETRADGQGHVEVNSEYRELEDGLDRGDLGIFIFAKAPTAAADAPENLIMKVTDLGSSTNPQQMITGSPGAYTITMAFKKTDFADALGGYELDPNTNNNIQFRVLILANCGKGNQATSWADINGQTFSEVIGQASDLAFQMSWLYEGNQGDADVTGLYKGNIPMFGTNTFSVSEADLWSSKAEERIYLGEINLLRALAKVRVVDNVQNKDEEGYPKVTEAEFIGSQDVAYCLPADAADYVDGNQVHTPNIYDPDKTLTMPEGNACTYKLGTILDGWNMTPEANRKGLTRIGYVPEQKIGYLNGNVQQGFPIFRITAALRKNADGSDETKVYDVPMIDPDEGRPINFGANILRNHIYTLSVNSIAVGTPANFTVRVDNWAPVEINLTYTETVTVEPRIDWIEGSYLNEDTETGRIYARPWSGDNAVLMHCTFKIRTPQGAKWTAYLIPLEGTNNAAFQFTDKDGNDLKDEEGNVLTTSTSGVVTTDTELTNLYIKPTIQTPTELNSAILQVVVTLGNGTTIEVPLTQINDKYKNYTIVQNQQ